MENGELWYGLRHDFKWFPPKGMSVGERFTAPKKPAFRFLCHPERSRGIYFLSNQTDLSIRFAQSR